MKWQSVSHSNPDNTQQWTAAVLILAGTDWHKHRSGPMCYVIRGTKKLRKKQNNVMHSLQSWLNSTDISVGFEFSESVQLSVLNGMTRYLATRSAWESKWRAFERVISFEESILADGIKFGSLIGKLILYSVSHDGLAAWQGRVVGPPYKGWLCKTGWDPSRPVIFNTSGS